MSGTKIILIVFAALAITLFIAMGIPAIKRKKLAEGLYKYMKEKKPDTKITLDQVKAGISKLDNKEVDTLIEFATAAQNKEWLKMAPLMKDMGPIVTKMGTELANEFFKA